jgi:hypothetical protein
MNTHWTDKKTARLIEFYEDGRSCSEIAKILGVEFCDKTITTNSVTGKIRNLRKNGVKIERIEVDD